MYSHDDFTDEVCGFIYLITYSNGQKYIGKKLIRSLIRMKPTKAQLAKRKNYKRIEWKNKPFARYVGSSKLSSGLTVSNKEILWLCKDKINLTYYEVKELIERDVLLDDTYLNENILGKFYKGKINAR